MNTSLIQQPQFRRSAALLAVAAVIAGLAAIQFRKPHHLEPLFPSSAPHQVRMLSAYHEAIKGTPADTEVYVYDSGVPGGSLLILGGAHPNEPASLLTSVAILENLTIDSGRVFIIPRANKSAFTHHDPQEAMLRSFEIETPHGPRTFRNGSRFTNPIHQWPDPSIYINPRGIFWEEQKQNFPADQFPFMANNPGPYGQTLGGVDSRNLNRVYPGVPNGTLTERLAFAIMMLIREENIDLAIDYHEASPEYPTIDVIVAHPRAADIAAMAELYLSDDGVPIVTDPSSPLLRGLSHREWGDASGTKAILMETANPAQGRLKGRTTVEQLMLGRDPAYIRAQMIENKLNKTLAARAERAEARGRTPGERRRKILYVEIPEEGIPLEVRVGRHLQSTVRLVEAFNDDHPDRRIGLGNLPAYREIVANGLGQYLRGPNGESPAWKAP